MNTYYVALSRETGKAFACWLGERQRQYNYRHVTVIKVRAACGSEACELAEREFASIFSTGVL